MLRLIIFALLPMISLLSCKENPPQPPAAPSTVVNPTSIGYRMLPAKSSLGITRQQFYPTAIVGPDDKNNGLTIDLQDKSLFGAIYTGIFYFDRDHSDYLYPRYRERTRLKQGRGLIRIRDFVDSRSLDNVNHWKDEGVVAYRIDAVRRDPKTGYYHRNFYDSSVRFKLVNGRFRKALTLTEGPRVNLITSDHPEWMVISFETDQPSRGWIEVENHGRFSDGTSATHHEIRVKNLQPDAWYRYRVVATDTGTDTLRSPYFPFQAAPTLGSRDVIFAYTGDSRSGYGGGERSYMGANRYILQQIGASIFRHNARFLLFGGDMINGYTNSTEDLILQLRAVKQSLFGLMVQRPFYTVQGNHEALNYVFDDSSRYGAGMDRWPYPTESTEAVFGQEFVNPTNGPEAAPDMPPYRENVYSFHFGNIKIIAFNNNYWPTSKHHIRDFGGSPEGYILPDQIEWIRRQVTEADRNPKIKYVFLLAHEPPFPNGGHVKDAMWYYGDNNRRAYVAHNGQDLRPFPKGIVETRDELWEIVSNSPKVAAVLASHEHAYNRTLITNKTPVGLYPQDDLNGNGKLDDGRYSPNPKFKYPTWQLTSGGAGAPFYKQQKAPWSGAVKVYNAQNNYMLLKESGTKLSLEVYSLTGQLLDRVDDLMAIKKIRR